MLFITLIASLLLAATSWAAPAFERELTTPASPLQVYNALTVDWQVRQWSGAAAVASEARPGGVWRWTYATGKLDEGVFEVAERGAALTYTHVLAGVHTRVKIEISAAGGAVLGGGSSAAGDILLLPARRLRGPFLRCCSCMTGSV